MNLLIGLLFTFLMVNNNDLFIDVTDTLSPTQFEKIEKIILEKGDKQTYSNRFNDNPHCLIDGIDIYLNPSNHRSSYINEITVHEWKNEDFKSYTLKLVRKGDLNNTDIYLPKGMQENRVYLMDYNGNIKLKIQKILAHLNAIKTKFDSKECDCIRKEPWTKKFKN